METGQGDPLGLTARPAKSLECPFASPQVDDGSARRRVELLLQRLHAPNGEEPFARKSTRRKPPKCLWRSETFSTVQGLLDTAASGLPNAPSAFAQGSVNGCGSRPDVGLRTNDAGNLRTGVPCSGSAAVRSRVTAADSLGGPIWTGHSRSPPPLLRQRPPGWLARSCVLAARQGRGSRGRARAHPAGRAHRQQPQPDRPLGQLVLDEVGPEAQHLVQNGARHRSEAMRRHLFRRDVQGPERTVLSDLSPDYRRFGRACLDGPSKRPSSRIIGPGADPLIGFNLARRYQQLDRRPFGVGVP